eukprot:4374136-Pyramimonas_sp.AAC.1
MEFTWNPHGVHMESTWNPHGIHMVFTWCLYGVCMVVLQGDALIIWDEEDEEDIIRTFEGTTA